ncbi:MAG: hypothetical protein LKE46_08435 [Clostridium sp.]|jgi:hypothetical protein|uniref:hypothetical protein n=1 Tax=Clostridium sp. TaxID=1506 RepID=UPI0025BC418A|nr:hypothetical protein [Clostridium sp.]MCH3964292.1 hypothetical protein [Clostridium sp.]MCI1715468.1 hypothetical protein [Clostridium sp.]MCI1799741.1 hypothetical protein [Clostridium sp.]MCI1813652.1 hypothetical protein [Clostridium sp.]MCI1870554.1 hypothetical protein [Clostridium sp.]
MIHCPEFSNVFDKCSDYLQDLFFKLAIAVSEYSCNKKPYVKDMESIGFRLEKPYTTGRKSQNYFMLTLKPQFNVIDVFVRTDGVPIHSRILELDNKGNRFSGGFEWYEFSVSEEEDIPEAVRIASILYKYD